MYGNNKKQNVAITPKCIITVSDETASTTVASISKAETDRIDMLLQQNDSVEAECLPYLHVPNEADEVKTNLSSLSSIYDVSSLASKLE